MRARTRNASPRADGLLPRRLAAVLAILLLGLPAPASAWETDTHPHLMAEALTMTNHPEIAALTNLRMPTSPLGTVAIDEGTCLEDPLVLVGETQARDILKGHVGDPDMIDRDIYGVPEIDWQGEDLNWNPADFFGIGDAACTVWWNDGEEWRQSYHGVEWFTDAPDYAQKFFDRAMRDFSEGRPAWGFLNLALGAHYVQEMGDPWMAGFGADNWYSEFFLNVAIVAGCLAATGPIGLACAVGEVAPGVDDVIQDKIIDTVTTGNAHRKFMHEVNGPELGNVLNDVNLRNFVAPSYGQASDYVKELAARSVGFGPRIWWEYAQLLAGQLPLVGSSREDLEQLARGLLAETAVHTTGYLIHALRSLPRLTVGNYTLDQFADHTRVSFRISNQGGIDAKNVRYEILELKPCDTEFESFLRCLASHRRDAGPVDVPAGGSVTVTREIRPPMDPDFSQRVVVDPPYGFTCETQSRFGCHFELHEAAPEPLPPDEAEQEVAPPPPDLSIEAGDITHLQAAVAARVHNVGEGPAPAFDVDFYSRDPDTGTLTWVCKKGVGGLAAGADELVLCPALVELPLVRVDEAGAVMETVEDANNQATSDVLVMENHFQQGGVFEPPGDVIILPNAIVTFDDVDVRLRDGARMYVQDGAELTLIRSRVSCATAGGGFYLQSEGRLIVEQSRVQDIVNGIEAAGATSTFKDSDFESSAQGFAIVARGGTLVVEGNRFTDGSGGGVFLMPGAAAHFRDNHLDGNNGVAVELVGGHADFRDDRILGSPTGLRVHASASVELENVTLEPRTGIRVAGPTQAVDVRGGVLVGHGVRIAAADVGLLASEGRITLEGGQLHADQGARLSGDAAALLRGVDRFDTADQVSDQASLRLEWPVHVRIVGPDPDRLPLSNASVELADAASEIVLRGRTSQNAELDLVLPEFVHTAAGRTVQTPYRLTSTYNHDPAQVTLAVEGPVDVEVVTPVLPDASLFRAEPDATHVGVSLRAVVANLEPARMSELEVEFYQHGVLLGTVTVPDVGPWGVANVTLPWSPPSGIADLEVRIDPFDVVEESRESNNALAWQAWIIRDRQPCRDAPIQVAGTILVRSGGSLVLEGCDLVLADQGHRPGQLIVEAGGLLDASRASRIDAADARWPFLVQVAGRLALDDVEWSGMETLVVSGEAVIRGATFEARARPAVFSLGGDVSIRDSTFGGTNRGGGVHAIGGSLELVDNHFKDMGRTAVTIEHTDDALVVGNAIVNATAGFLLVNASITVEDASISLDVEPSFEILGSHVTLMNVTHTASSVRMDPGSTAKIGWHVRGRVLGADGDPAPNVTVTVIDRAGRWLGQFDTSADGRTMDLRLIEHVLQDLTDDGVPEIPSWLRLEPYTLKAGLVEVLRDLEGNGDLVVPQSYRTATTSKFPFLQFALGSTLTYPVKVRNTGNGMDTVAFALRDVPDEWDATLSDTGAVLTPGQIVDLSVTVTAPNEEDALARFNLTTTSEDGATLSRLELSAKTGPNIEPTALYVATPLVVYKGANVTFDDQSSDVDGWIVSRHWEFGDGTTSTLESPIHAFSAQGTFPVELTVEDNSGAAAIHIVTVEVLNRAPGLSEGDVSPDEGSTVEGFTYSVLYEDADGDAPDSIQVLVDGLPRDMQLQQEDPDFVQGVRYATTVSGLASGSHAYRFVTTDPGGATQLFPPNSALQGPQVDDAPALSEDSVTPASGDAETLFTYRVVYTDPDGQPPGFVRVGVDEDPPVALVRETPFEDDYADGVAYVARLAHAPGTHAYRFEASDGLHAAAPLAGSGPAVTGAAQLGDPRVSPDAADPGSTFAFGVRYQDAAGRVPDAVRVLVDGGTLAMDAVDEEPDFVAGADFEAAVILSGSGLHPYGFEATVDGTTKRWPREGVFDGPLTNQAPHALIAFGPSSGTVQTDFFLNASASTDPDGENLPIDVRIDWGDGSVLEWQREPTVLHRYVAPGTFAARVLVRDAWGRLSDEATASVQVIDQPPTAGFNPVPGGGAAEEGDGLGTTFAFRPNGVGDVEDTVHELELRWDFEGDGTWDTAWVPGVQLAYHVYGDGGDFDARQEVRDHAGHVASATRRVFVEGTRPLDLDTPIDRAMRAQGERHYYRIEVPDGLLNIFAALEEDGEAGADFKLYLQQGAKPDPDACDTPDCVEGGIADRACMRLPDPGTYFVLVDGEDLADPPANYSLNVRTDVTAVGEASALLRCMVLAPLPQPVP